MARRLFATPEAMQDMVDDYFDEIEINGRKPTISGIAYHLGFSNITSFHHYKTHDNESFRRVHDRAVLRATICREEKMDMSWLKNVDPENWTDRVQVEAVQPDVDKTAAIAQIQALVQIAQMRKAKTLEHVTDDEETPEWMN